jgi:hypothetical protein
MGLPLAFDFEIGLIILDNYVPLGEKSELINL